MVESNPNASPPPEAPRAKAQLGLRLLLAKDGSADPARGAALIEEAALAGDAEASFVAATLAGAGAALAQSWDAALDHLARAAEGGHAPARSSLRILAGGPSGGEAAGEDWAALRAAVDLAPWFAPPAVQALRETPRIWAIEKFAPPAACDWLVAQAEGRLARATIYDKATGGAVKDARRSNSQCDLDFDICGLMTFVLRARIGALVRRPDQALEIPKILHYAPGQTFADHFDYLDPRQPAYAAELAARGQRIATFLIYLNDDYAGGETCFTRIGLAHKGAKGDALLFANVDSLGRPDRDTMHAGLPPTSGEKWVFSQWIRALPRA